MAGRKDTKIVSHQKQSVVGTSSMQAMPFHFLSLLVKALAITATTYGMHLAIIYIIRVRVRALLLGDMIELLLLPIRKARQPRARP